MRSYLVTAAILACVLPGSRGPLAQKPQQSSVAPSASTGAEDTWQSTLSRDVQGVLGKEVRSGSGENIGRIVDVLVDKGRQVRAGDRFRRFPRRGQPKGRSRLGRAALSACRATRSHHRSGAQSG